MSNYRSFTFVTSNRRVPSLVIVPVLMLGQLLVGAMANESRADIVAPVTPRDQNLDQELLQDLSLEPTVDASREGMNGVKGGAADDPALLGDGEDIGSSSHPLQRIMVKMRTVEQRMKRLDTSKATRDVQQEIVRELDELIKANEQSAKSNASRSGMSRAEPVPTPKAEPGKLAGNGLPDPNTTRDGGATGRGGEGEGEPEVWGTLPPRFREAMVRAGVDQFLPKYQEVIEDYFRSLAREQSK